MTTRRDFLVVVGGAAAFGALSLRCGTGEASGPISAGNVRSVAVGHFSPVAGQPLVLGRDAGGLYSMSTLCTHEGCDISQGGSITGSGLQCPCHGARFSTAGTVLVGPARSPLPHYRVDLAADGSITIQAGTVVSASTRTAIPA